MNETLFFKDKIIHGNNVELIFHKDYTHIYNNEAFPVVKYTLLNCEDLAKNLDYYNDGLLIETRPESNYSVFEAKDMGGHIFKIACEQIIKEELEYGKQDYIDLLKEIIKQSDEEHEVTSKYHHQLQMLKAQLEKDIGVNERKLQQADWISSEKRKFLEGELSSSRKILKLLINPKNPL